MISSQVLMLNYMNYIHTKIIKYSELFGLFSFMQLYWTEYISSGTGTMGKDLAGAEWVPVYAPYLYMFKIIL